MNAQKTSLRLLRRKFSVIQMIRKQVERFCRGIKNISCDSPIKLESQMYDTMFSDALQDVDGKKSRGATGKSHGGAQHDG